MVRVLLVDDDVELTGLLGEFLAGEGFEVAVAADGEAAVQAALSSSPDLVILDVMLPRLNGFEVLRRIRERSSVPVIMLTARGEAVDRIVGLELGADDYLPKPFNPRELAARARAVLRRARGALGAHGGLLVVGDIEVDSGARRVRRGGEAMELTSTEFSILEMLARDAGNVVRREVLFREVLGRRPASYDRSLDMHVSNLRRKLGPRPDGAERIVTVRGVGYQYVQPGA